MEDMKVDRGRRPRRGPAQKLNEFQTHLEELVQERTAALTAAHDRLRLEIEESRQAEEAARAAEAELWWVFAAVNDVIIVFDGLGRHLKILLTNPHLLPKPADTLLGKTVHEVFPPLQADFFLEHIRHALAMRRTVNLEYSWSIGGEETWFTAAVLRIRADRVVWVARDITEHKRAAAALLQKEQEFRMVVGNIPAVIFQGYADGTVDLFDHHVEEITGYAKADFDSRRLKWTDLIVPEDREGAKMRFVQALKTRQPYVREYRLTKKGGEVVWIQERSQIVRRPDGKIDYVSGVFFDITARKRNEERLITSEANYRAIFDSANDAIFVHDAATGAILDINRKMCEMYGYTPEEARRLQVADLSAGEPPYTQEEALSRVRQTVAGKPQLFQWLARDKAGARFWVEVNLKRARIGGQDRLLALVRDITHRKQAEEALREGELFLAGVFASIQDGLSVLDLDYNIVQVNHAMEKWYAHALPLVGKKCYEAYHGRKAPCDPCPTRRTIATGEPQVEEGHRGDQGWIEVYAYPWRDMATGAIKGVIEYVRDITHRKQAEETIKESYLKLQRSLDGTVTALASTVEMRDPYTAGHQDRVTQLACAMAQEMGFPEDRIQGIRVMGFLHDIGKIAVPAEILSKPCTLGEYEMSLVRTHPAIGYDILQRVDFPWPVAQAVLQHHERLDGSGYPAGLLDQEIIPEAKILAVADVVEAMASHRPYRPALGIDRAMTEISRNRGILYDPDAVDACIKVLHEKKVEL